MYKLRMRALSILLLVSVFMYTMYVGIFTSYANTDESNKSIYEIQKLLGGEGLVEVDDYTNTIKLLQDIKLTEPLNIDESINIDLNEKTIEADSTITAFNINCSDAENSVINIFNGKIVSSDGHNGINIIKGVVTLSDLEVEAKNSSADAGSNAVYIDITDSNSSVNIETSQLLCNSEDPGSFGLYIEDADVETIRISDTDIAKIYIPLKLSIKRIIAEQQESNQELSLSGILTGLRVTAGTAENVADNGDSLVKFLGGTNFAESKKVTKDTRVGTTKFTNNIYTVTLKQNVTLIKPIRLVSNATTNISSFIIDLDGHTISPAETFNATSNNATTLLLVGGTNSHRGPGKVEIKNGKINCSNVNGLTALQLGSMMTQSVTSGSLKDIGVDSTIKLTKMVIVGGNKPVEKKPAGNAVEMPIIVTGASIFDVWPHVIVDGSSLIGGKGRNEDKIDEYGYGLTIQRPNNETNEAIIDLRADSGATYISRIFNSEQTEKGRSILREDTDENLTYESGFVNSEKFFVQTRKYVNLSNNMDPEKGGNITIFSPEYPHDVTMTDNNLKFTDKDTQEEYGEEYVNVLIRKQGFLITIPAEATVGNEGEHTKLEIKAENIELPNNKAVQLSFLGDEMTIEDKSYAGVTLSFDRRSFITSLSKLEGENVYSKIDWLVGENFEGRKKFILKKFTNSDAGKIENLYVDGINPAVPPGEYQGNVTFIADIVDK